jgi:polysaccharide chain length determinant protein (PEP-CTERM system associated)
MNQLFEQVVDTLRGLWRFRWVAIGVAWTVCLAGWVFVILIPNTYSASARVFVDTRTTLSQVTQGLAVDSNLESQLQRVRQALLSSPLLEKVAHETGLDARSRNPAQRQLLIAALRDRIDLTANTSGGVSGTYVISYRDTNRERAQKVVEQLLNVFVQDTMGGKKEGSEAADRFLMDQIADFEKRLAADEERLAAFKRQNVGMMPGAQGDYFTRLQAEMDALGKAKTELSVSERRREEISRQVRGEQPFISGPTPAPAASAIPGLPAPGAAPAGALGADTASRIRETQARLDELLLRFTEKHPDVIALRQALADLQQRQKQDIEQARHGDLNAQAGLGLTANPVFQSIQLQLNQTDVEIAAGRAEVADHEARIVSLRKLVDTAPEVEAQFARLNRDYDVTRTHYQALVERLEKARLGEDAEATGVVRFEVVDPPSADFAPIAPKRPLLIVAVLLAGLGAGGMLAYALHQIRPVFTLPRQLAAITGLPVLGVINMTWREKHRSLARRGHFAAVAAVGMLFVVGAVVLIGQNQAVHLVRQWLT